MNGNTIDTSKLEVGTAEQEAVTMQENPADASTADTAVIFETPE